MKVFLGSSLHYHKDWDEILNESFPLITTVNQPMRNLLTDEMWDKICRITKGQEKLDSLSSCYCSLGRYL